MTNIVKEKVRDIHVTRDRITNIIAIIILHVAYSSKVVIKRVEPLLVILNKKQRSNKNHMKKVNSMRRQIHCSIQEKRTSIVVASA